MRVGGQNAGGAGQAGGASAALQSGLRERSKAHKQEATMVRESFLLLKEAGVIFEQEGETSQVEAVQETARQLLELLAQVDTNTAILNDLYRDNKRPDESLTQFMARRITELQASRSEDGYKKHHLWGELRQELWQVNHPDEPLPEFAGDELYIAKKINLKCPLSQLPLEDPVKNPACGHNFSKAVVEDYIKRRQKKREAPECPVVGCGSILADLERDVDAERALARKKRPKGKGTVALELE